MKKKKIITHNIAQLYKHGFAPKRVMKMLPKKAIGYRLYGANEVLIGEYKMV